MKRRGSNKIYVLGIDLSYSGTGICFYDINNEEDIFSTTLSISNKKVTKEKKQKMFLEEVFIYNNAFEDLIKKSDLICIEKPFNIRGHGQVLIELFGIIKFHIFKHNIPYLEIAQTTLKKFATTSGKAEKSQMVMQAFREFNFEGKTEDEVDAFWCAKVAECYFKQPLFHKYRVESMLKAKVVIYE